MFNSLKYAKQLEEVGVSREQAETHMMIMTEIMETNLATKQDLADSQVATKLEFSELRYAMKELENKIVQSEYRLTIKLGTIVSIAIGVAVTITKLF